MSRTAQLLGAVAVTSGWVLWQRLRPPPCPGGVSVEFHPPLLAPGPYHFELTLDRARRTCAFDVSLPLLGPADKTGCGLALELRTQNRGQEVSITGLTFGARPDRFRLRVRQGQGAIYDTELTPQYAPYETRRAEDKRFCGERARVQPACIRGSSQCPPYPAKCDGPEDCETGKVCCATPEWGRDYGVRSAVDCDSRRSCLSRYAHIVCHQNEDCPKDMSCTDTTLESEFSPHVRACAPLAARR